MNLDALEKRISALRAQNIPLTFEAFKAAWDESDELSKSLIELSVTCPALASDMDTGRREKIAAYLAEMGVEVTVETATLEELIARLESDP